MREGSTNIVRALRSKLHGLWCSDGAEDLTANQAAALKDRLRRLKQLDPSLVHVRLSHHVTRQIEQGPTCCVGGLVDAKDGTPTPSFSQV
jgi:hypothetical protein